MSQFEQMLRDKSWDFILSEQDAKLAFEKFYDKIDYITDKAFPLVTKNTMKKDKINFPWFTSGLTLLVTGGVEFTPRI